MFGLFLSLVLVPLLLEWKITPRWGAWPILVWLFIHLASINFKVLFKILTMSVLDKLRYKELVTKRSSIKEQITKYNNYLINIFSKEELNNFQLQELRLILSKLETLSLKHDDLQNEKRFWIPMDSELILTNKAVLITI